VYLLSLLAVIVFVLKRVAGLQQQQKTMTLRHVWLIISARKITGGDLMHFLRRRAAPPRRGKLQRRTPARPPVNLGSGKLTA
jgi:hypothetical protein